MPLLLPQAAALMQGSPEFVAMQEIRHAGLRVKAVGEAGWLRSFTDNLIYQAI